MGKNAEPRPPRLQLQPLPGRSSIPHNRGQCPLPAQGRHGATSSRSIPAMHTLLISYPSYLWRPSNGAKGLLCGQRGGLLRSCTYIYSSFIPGLLRPRRFFGLLRSFTGGSVTPARGGFAQSPIQQTVEIEERGAQASFPKQAVPFVEPSGAARSATRKGQGVVVLSPAQIGERLRAMRGVQLKKCGIHHHRQSQNSKPSQYAHSRALPRSLVCCAAMRS